MNDHTALPPGVIYLPNGSGRSYLLGRMRSVFKADGEETKNTYSISEWWLEPHQTGPGAHSHEANDDIFYVLEGTVTFLAVTSGWMRQRAHSCESRQGCRTTSKIEAMN